MNLLDRAMAHAADEPPEGSIGAILKEMAGEVERLWAFEKEANAEYGRLCAIIEEKNAENAALKAKRDTAGMLRQWAEGYKLAASQFHPVLFNLLRAADIMEPVTSEGYDHDGP